MYITSSLFEHCSTIVGLSIKYSAPKGCNTFLQDYIALYKVYCSNANIVNVMRGQADRELFHIRKCHP